MKNALAEAVTKQDEALAERDRYRELYFGKLIRDTAAEAITKFGGRSRVLNVVVEEQLAVREIGNKFHVIVVDPSTGADRPGISVSDLLTQMRGSADFAAAFETKPDGPRKLAKQSVDAGK